MVKEKAPSNPKEKNEVIVLPPHSKWWLAVIVFSFISAIATIGGLISGGYYYDSQGAWITAILFLAFSVVLTYALDKRDEKLLRWTGILEFMVLLLPLLLFDANSSYLPYAITPIFLFTFPVLWTIIPIALLENEKNPLKRNKYMTELIVITVILAVSWVLSPQFNSTYYTYSHDAYGYYGVDTAYSSLNWNIYLLMLGLLLVPLAIWLLEYRHMVRLSHPQHPLKGIYGHVENNLPEVLLVLAILILFLIGFAMKPAYSYDGYDCGNGICEGYEDIYSCPYDCGTCGDGFCDWSEEGWCDEDCEVYNDITYSEVKVYVSGGLTCDTIRVSLKDRNGNLIGAPKESQNRAISFSNMESTSLYALVSSPQSTKPEVFSQTIDMTEANTIRITLPDDYCDVDTSPESLLPSYDLLLNFDKSYDFQIEAPLFSLNGRLLEYRSTLHGTSLLFEDINEPAVYLKISSWSDGSFYTAPIFLSEGLNEVTYTMPSNFDPRPDTCNGVETNGIIKTPWVRIDDSTQDLPPIYDYSLDVITVGISQSPGDEGIISFNIDVYQPFLNDPDSDIRYKFLIDSDENVNTGTSFLSVGYEDSIEIFYNHQTDAWEAEGFGIMASNYDLNFISNTSMQLNIEKDALNLSDFDWIFLTNYNDMDLDILPKAQFSVC
jgi:hypothetical protein